jgi:site-specific DNA-methyltransferase (adenine-specific)
MKPYYQDDAVTLYFGDCREILPQLPKHDLVVMDPPYGMDFQSCHRLKKHPKIANDKSLPIDLILGGIDMATRAAYVFCRWDNLQEMPVPKSVLAWVKNNWSMGDLKHEHGRQWEACCFYAKEQHEFINRIPDVIFAERTGNTLHPTQKPESLIRRIVSANVGEAILDPFAGSGTTGVAAKLEGRKATLIELDERYCEIAAKRLEQQVFEFGD